MLTMINVRPRPRSSGSTCREGGGRGPVHRHAGKAPGDTELEAIAEGREPGGLQCQILARMRQASPRPAIPRTFRVPGRMPRSWPPPNWIGEGSTRGLRPRTRLQRSNALGRVELVAGEREEVENPHRLDIERDLPRGLGGVHVEETPASVADLTDLGDRVQRCRLVLGHHDAHGRRIAGVIAAFTSAAEECAARIRPEQGNSRSRASRPRGRCRGPRGAQWPR